MKTKEQIEERMKMLSDDFREDDEDLVCILKAQEIRVLGWILKDED